MQLRTRIHWGACACLLVLTRLLGFAQADLDPERIGGWPGYTRGPAYAVAISGRYACVAAGSFEVLDVGNPSSPRRLGGCPTGGMAYRVAVANSYAYVADQQSGLQVIDIQDPTQPRIVGSYRQLGGENTSYVGVTVSGAMIWLVSSYFDDSGHSFGRLEVVDVSEPTAPRRVSSLGLPAGSPKTVTRFGKYAYVGGYFGLHIIDVSDPMAPRIIGGQPGALTSVAVSGQHALAIDHNASPYPILRVLDVSRPEAPRRVGTLAISGSANGVAVSGTTVYLAVSDGGAPGARKDSGLLVVDVTDPSRPMKVASHATGGEAYSVTISGGMAYVAAEAHGVQIFDVGQPAAPTLKSKYRTLGRTASVALADGRAYLADGNAGLQVLDVAQPDHPRWLGGFAPLGEVVRAAVSGPFVYLIERFANPTNFNDTLHVLDSRGPGNPRPVAALPIPAWSMDLAVNGNYAYVGGESLQVIDVSNPLSPFPKGAYRLENYTTTVAVSGGYAYLGSNDGGVRVFDVSDPANPRPVGGYSSGMGQPTGITLWDRYAAVAVGSGWIEPPLGLLIMDVRDPARPGGIAFYHAPISRGKLAAADGRAYAADIVDLSVPSRPVRIGYVPPGSDAAVSGAHLFIAADEAGLEVFDVSRRAKLRRVGEFATPRNALRVSVSGKHAYVSEQQWDSSTGDVHNRLEVLDISKPGAPRLVGGGETEEFYEKFAVSGSFACAAADSGKLLVLDVADPAHPQVVGTYRFDTGPTGLAVLEQHAYVTLSGGGLLVFDLSHPEAPRLAGRLKTKGNMMGGIAISGHYAFIADGLTVVDISDPSAPQLISHLDLSVSAVALSGGYACLAAGNAGLQVFDVSDPARPKWVAAVETGQGTSDVAVSGKYVYVSDSRAGLSLIDLSDPVRPRRLGGNTAFDAFGLAEGQGQLLVAAGPRGVMILDPYQPAPQLTLGKRNTQSLELRLRAQPGQSLRLQSSANLRDWVDLQSLEVFEADQRLLELDPGAQPLRFYRTTK